MLHALTKLSRLRAPGGMQVSAKLDYIYKKRASPLHGIPEDREASPRGGPASVDYGHGVLDMFILRPNFTACR